MIASCPERLDLFGKMGRGPTIAAAMMRILT